jgi:hypothetical protein
MKTTQKTIALVRLILGEIDMWEQRLQRINMSGCGGNGSAGHNENHAIDDGHACEAFEVDRAERMADMLASAFEIVTGAHGELLHNQRAQHVCAQALKASQDALKYATPLTWTLSAHKHD